MSIYRVSREIFPDVDEKLSTIRFVQSEQTEKWYVPVVEVAQLVNVSQSNLKSQQCCYHWNTEKDGDCLLSEKTSNQIELSLYFPVDALVGMYLFNNHQQREALAPWVTSDEEVAKYARLLKKRAARKRGRPSKQHNQKEEVISSSAGAADAKKYRAEPAVDIPPYQQLAREWLEQNMQTFLEEAIKRLMQQDEVRRDAIHQVAKEIALRTKPPTTKDVLDNFFNHE